MPARCRTHRNQESGALDAYRKATHFFLDSNDPKPLKRALRAIVLHTFGDQVVIPTKTTKTPRIATSCPGKPEGSKNPTIRYVSKFNVTTPKCCNIETSHTGTWVLCTRRERCERGLLPLGHNRLDGRVPVAAVASGRHRLP